MTQKQSVTATLLEQLHEMEEAGHIGFWHNNQNEPFMTLEVNGRYENHALKSTVTKLRLSEIVYTLTGKTLNENSYKEVLSNLEGKSLFQGPQLEDRYRVGRYGEDIYIDLGDKDWNYVRVGRDGWSVSSGKCPVRFRRAEHTNPLPHPIQGYSIEIISNHLNISSEKDLVLIIAFVIYCYIPEGPYPLLSLTGEQGSAKSSAARLFVRLTDPKKAPLRALPSGDRDLMISAEQSQVMAFDNISSITNKTSDALCRLATGAGLSTRKMYKDSDEMVFEATRPVILTGINESVSRSDLADRTISVQLDPISPSNRISESKMNYMLERDLPYMFGFLLDTLSEAMKIMDSVLLENPPRMIDFARTGEAVAIVLGMEPGSFMDSYSSGQTDTYEQIVDSSPIGEPIRILIKHKGEWSGTASELLIDLNEIITEEARKRKTWPTDAARLSRALRTIAPALRSEDIQVDFDTPKRRYITLSKSTEFTDITDTPSQW